MLCVKFGWNWFSCSGEGFYLTLEKNMALHFQKCEPLPKVAVCQIRLKLVIYIRRQDGYLEFFDSKRRKDDRTTKRIVKKKMAQITHNRNQCSYPVADGIFNYASWSGLCSQGLCRFLIFSLLILNQIIAVTWLKYCRYDVKLYPINQSINQNVLWGRSFPPIHIMLVSK